MSHDHDHDHDHDHAFPDDVLPEGAVVDGAALDRAAATSRRPSTSSSSGSGAAGAVAAHTLAKAGFSVAIVEEGPWVRDARVRRARVRRVPAHVPRRGHAGLEGRVVHPAHPGAVRRRQHGHELGHRAPHAGGRAGRVGRALRAGRHVTAEALEPRTSTRSSSDLNVHAVNDDVLGENNRLFLDEASARRACPRARCTATSAAAGARAAA